MRHNIVGICGTSGSGKSEAGQALIDQGFTRIAFGDAVKAAVTELNPLIWLSTQEDPIRLKDLLTMYGGGLDAWDIVKKNPDARRYIQVMGTEVGRNMFDSDIWVNKARNGMLSYHSSVTDFVFTDVRFPNEARMILDHGGLLVWVHRPGVEKINDHSSESSDCYGMCQVVLTNSGTKEELHWEVREAAGLH